MSALDRHFQNLEEIRARLQGAQGGERRQILAEYEMELFYPDRNCVTPPWAQRTSVVFRMGFATRCA